MNVYVACLFGKCAVSQEPAGDGGTWRIRRLRITLGGRALGGWPRKGTP